MAADNSKIISAVEDQLQRYGDLIVTRVREQLLAAGKLATGNTYNSVVFDVTTDQGIVRLSIYANDIFKYIENGRTAGSKYPPLEKIIQWIEIRGIRPKSFKIPKKPRNLDRSKRSLAFLIGRKIARDGIKPLNSLTQAIDETQDVLFDNISNVVLTATTELIGEEFKKAAEEFISENIKITITY